MLLSACSLHFLLVRVPRSRYLLEDFGVAIDGAALLFVTVPWVPLALSLLTLVCAMAAMLPSRRGWLVAAYVLALLSAAALLLGRMTLTDPLTRIAEDLIAVS